ncbi:MAG: Chromate resistance protein ChrB [Solirubrobacteraceae bacterium]
MGAHRRVPRGSPEHAAVPQGSSSSSVARGRAGYTELEESHADLARHQKWLAAIRARDYFGAPGGQEAAAAVLLVRGGTRRVREQSAVGQARRVHFRQPARTARRRGRHRLTHRTSATIPHALRTTTSGRVVGCRISRRRSQVVNIIGAPGLSCATPEGVAARRG